MLPHLEFAEMPADAIEVGRIADAWGIKGWFKVLPHSASPEALFSSKRWYLLPSDRNVGGNKSPSQKAAAVNSARAAQPVLLKIQEAKEHADTLVASSLDVADRNQAEALKGLAFLCRDLVFQRRAPMNTIGSTCLGWMWSTEKGWRWVK